MPSKPRRRSRRPHEIYEEQRAGLARRFLAAVERVMMVTAKQPLSGAIRRHLVPGFPYAIIYEAHHESVRVLAIAHLRRHPGFWVDR